MSQQYLLRVGVTFSDRTGMRRVLVPVITPEGNIKVLKTCPSNQPTAWLVHDWDIKNGVPHRLKSVALAGERLDKGAKFLRQAYEEEGWPEGWEEYQAYLDRCTTREVEGEDGKMQRVPLRRHVAHVHFDESLLPKYALKLRDENASGRRRDTQWKPAKKIVHPQDRKPAPKAK